MLAPAVAEARTRAAGMSDWVARRSGLEPPRADALFRRIRERQEAVGYAGSYGEWIARATPPDLA